MGWGSKLKAGASSLLGSAKNAMGLDQFKSNVYNVNQNAFSQGQSGTGTQEALRQRQLAQTGRLEAQASGQAPSIAEAQLRAASNRSLAQQLAATQAQRGGNAGAKQRLFARSQGAARRDVSEQAATAKLQERQLAEQNLSSQMQNQRAQDVALSQADASAKQDYEKLKVQQNLGIEGINQTAQAQSAAARGNFVSKLGEAAGMKFGSDKNNKQNIQKEESNTSNTQEKQEVKTTEKPEIKTPEPSEKQEVKISEAPAKAEFNMPSRNAVAVEAPYKEKEGGSGGMGLETIAKMAPMIMSAMSDIKNKMNVKEEGRSTKDDDRFAGPNKEISEAFTSKLESTIKEGKGKEEKPSKLATISSGLKRERPTANSSHLASQMISAISDKNCKQNIKSKDESFNPKSFLDKLQAYSYEYKDDYKNNPIAGHGRRLGIMAQDLEKAGPVGKSMVKETPTGKAVDFGSGFGAILAAQAHLNKRLSELESKKKS